MNKFLISAFLISIFATFSATRFSNLNAGHVDDDTFSWLYRINLYQWVISSNLKGIDIGDKDIRYAGTISYHPGVTIMTFSGISTRIGKNIKMKSDPQYESCPYLDYKCKYLDYELFIAKLPIIIISGLLLVISVYFLSSVFSLKEIILWVFTVVFEPILLSSSQLLHLDFLFGMFSISAISALFYGVKTDKKWAVLLSGGFMGFALLTRFAGSFMLPGILASLFYIDSKNFIKNSLIFALGGVITFVGFYPPMWVAPIATLTYIVKSSAEISDNLAGVIPAHIKYFSNLSWYFSVYIRELSVYLLVFWVLGLAGIFLPNIKNKRHIFSLLIIYLTYFAFINLADKQYSRYIVPVVIGITVSASIGFYNLVSLILRRDQILRTRAKMYTWLLSSHLKTFLQLLSV